MSKTTKKPNKKNIAKTETDELKNDLGQKMALQSVHDSEGGQILIDSLVEDILGVIDRVCMEVETLSHTELISLVCKMKERIDIVRVLTSAKANREVLDDLVAEAMKAEKENPPLPPDGQ